VLEKVGNNIVVHCCSKRSGTNIVLFPSSYSRYYWYCSILVLDPYS